MRMTVGMLRVLGLLLFLLIMIESCAAQRSCGKIKKACKKRGGVCQSQDADCDGELLIGNKYCSNKNKCGCCVPPPDCSKGTLQPCVLLNGTCISQDDVCNGREEINKIFCKSSDSCKCCFSKECDCENERQCERPDAAYKGFHPYGHCRKSCHSNEVLYDSCNINNQDCSCCLRETTQCNPAECQSGTLTGRCSRTAIPGWVIVGGDDLQEKCEDGCDCWVEEGTQECNPTECWDGNIVGRCSRYAIPGSSNLGPSGQCKDGCDCWVNI
ncbi:unnamed protein product, partial [Meganyctiphanes norvegica]